MCVLLQCLFGTFCRNLFPISFCLLAAVICIVLFMSAYPCFSLLQHLHFFVDFATNALTVMSFYSACTIVLNVLLLMNLPYLCHLEYTADSGLFTFSCISVALALQGTLLCLIIVLVLSA
jgi:hypothetical protein